MSIDIYSIVPRKYAKHREDVEQPSDPAIRFIPLTRGQYAIIDAADYEWLNQWTWGAHYDSHVNGFYAVRNLRIDGQVVRITMHRQILSLGFGDKRVGDHISGATLDNRRSNLRIASALENSRNRSINANHSCGLKGVHKRGSSWKARIRVNGNLINLGSFPTPDLAHRAYAKAATEHFEDFARMQ
jgi:hypothetical protein